MLKIPSILGPKRVLPKYLLWSSFFNCSSESLFWEISNSATVGQDTIISHFGVRKSF